MVFLDVSYLKNLGFEKVGDRWSNLYKYKFNDREWIEVFRDPRDNTFGISYIKVGTPTKTLEFSDWDELHEYIQDALED